MLNMTGSADGRTFSPAHFQSISPCTINPLNSLSPLTFFGTLVAMEFLSRQKKGEITMVKLHRIMKILVCFSLMTAFTGYAATEKHETTGQYVDDSVITTRVKTAIFKEDTLKTLQINVKTYKGVVQLSGFVDSTQSISKAGEIAQRVENVVSVKNDLIVK
jgi:hypothetical protein